MNISPGDEEIVDLTQEVSDLIRKKLLAEVDSPDEDLLTSGVLDSLTLIQLLVHLETHFGIRIPLEELELDDVRSVTAIARMVKNRRGLLPLGASASASLVVQKAIG